MKKFTLLLGALFAVMTAGAELTNEQASGLRLTADELKAAETTKRIAIRCTQGTNNNQDTYYCGQANRVRMPLKEEMFFDWEPAGDGTFYIKKTFGGEDAYLQNTNITTFGSKESATVAKFTAVKPTPDGNGVTLFGGGDCFETPDVGGEYYVRLSLGDKWFNFNGNTYNSGTGVWTVQNIIDLSNYYKLTINEVKDGVTTTSTTFVPVGETITVPVYGEYLSDYVATTKTADDNQVITVNYVPLIELGENASVPTKIVDGAVITLQCKDNNGGYDYYFNGAGSAKTATLQPTNLFKVVAVDPSAEIVQSSNAVTGTTTIAFYLQQYTTGKYVGKSGEVVSAVDTKENAAQFVAYIPKSTLMDSWTTKPEEYKAGVNTIRFETSSTYLNCQPKAVTPKYAAGKGGYSYWFVNAYSEAEAEEIINGSTEVVFKFPAFGDQTLTMTVEVETDTDAATIIPAVPFFSATGLEGDDNVVTIENKVFNVIGTWTFPFEDEEVYRIDIRKKGATDNGTCSNLLYNAATNQVDTRNGTNADAFVPERLFYLDAKGFTTEGNLKATLHTIAVDANKGLQVATPNQSKGIFTETPIEFLVVTNSTGTEGVSLRHPDNAICHINDINGFLSIWNHANSQNDVGSFLRFGELTDSDFDSLMSTAFAEFITQEMLDAAKASKSADDVRALFSAAPYVAAVAEAEALLQSIDGYTAEHFGEELGYLYGTDYETIMTFVGTLQAVLTDTDAGAITAATEALAAEVAKVQVHLPEAGKYYRFKGVEGGWYITPSAATGQMAMTAEPSANSAFLFDEAAGDANVFTPYNVVFETGITGTYGLGGEETYTFYPSQSKVIGAFTVKSNTTGSAGQWLYNHYDKGEAEHVVNRNSVFHERCNWYLEEVDRNGNTGIEEITVESDKVQGIYDLQGRRLSVPVKGINIINGKKVLVK
ncbi:MAG: hypothetical protein E7082_07760 [Bacteroidales bacterium]|nr:hypothetical protein [Bacteroidales bacterium]